MDAAAVEKFIQDIGDIVDSINILSSSDTGSSMLTLKTSSKVIGGGSIVAGIIHDMSLFMEVYKIQTSSCHQRLKGPQVSPAKILITRGAPEGGILQS